MRRDTCRFFTLPDSQPPYLDRLNSKNDETIAQIYCTLNNFVSMCVLQKERDKLLAELENLSHVSDENAQKWQEVHTQKLSQLESQVIHDDA